MKRQKNSENASFVKEAKLERLLYQACQRGGWLFATTENDVAREEQRQVQDPLDIPVDLRDPERVWERAQRTTTTPKIAPKIDPETKDNLARAAREGTLIPQDMQERMYLDRKESQSGL